MAAAKNQVAKWFQHTAARRRLARNRRREMGRKSFNTQPPEGGWAVEVVRGYPQMVSTHSRPKAAGDLNAMVEAQPVEFQHTAARRRLA